MKGLMVYTAIFGDRDTHKPQAGDFDYQFFTEKAECFPRLKDPSRTAKQYKFRPHLLFPKHEYSVWIDGNMVLHQRSIDEFVYRHMRDANLALIRSPHFKSVYKEAERLLGVDWDNAGTINDQIERYHLQGYTGDNGSYCGGFLIRRHNQQDVIEFDKQWDFEVFSGSRRDQLSLPYCLWKTGIKFSIIEPEDWLQYFKFEGIRKKMVSWR